MPEPEDTRQNPEPSDQPPGGQWQFPDTTAQPAPWPPTPPAAQPGAERPPTPPTAQPGAEWPATPPGGQPRAEWPATPPGGQPAVGYGGTWGQAPGVPTMGTAAPPPLARPRRGATILLATATAVFLIAAAVLGALYLSERSAHNRTQQQVTTHRIQLDGLQDELDSTKGKLTSAEQAKREQESRAADLETRNAELQKCADGAGEFFAAVKADDQARGERAIANMVDTC